MLVHSHQYSKTEYLLQWMFCRSDCEIGIRSNWGAMVSASCFKNQPGKQYEDPYTTGALMAVRRRRPLERAFFRVSSEMQSVLYAACSFSRRVHPYAERFLGAQAPIAYLLIHPDELERLLMRIDHGTASGHEKLKMTELRKECESLYMQALAAFQGELTKEKREKL